MDVGEPPGGPRGRGRALGGHPREQGVGPLAFIFGERFFFIYFKMFREVSGLLEFAE